MDENRGPQREQEQKKDGLQEEVPMEENPAEYSFMQEMIKDEAGGKRKIRNDIWRTAGLGLVFGIVASFSFCAVKPWMENRFQKDPQQVTIPEEEEEEEGAETEKPEETEVIEPVLDTDSYRKMQKAVSAVAVDAEKSVVEITGITDDQAWMTEAYDHSGSVSGLIVADNGRELLILGKISPVKGAGEIRVTFSDGATCTADILMEDSSLDLGVYSVARSVIPESTWAQIKTAVLGSSTTAQKGDPVIVLGRQFGYAGSMGFGTMSSNKNTIETADGRYHLICTDIAGAIGGTGVIVNLNGEIIGMIDQSISEGEGKNLVTGYGISDLKKNIELLSNGQAVPYIGIRGLDVTSDMEDQGIPKGVYVREVETNSPAMAAGIQSGDVITKIEGTKVASLSAYHTALMDEKSGIEVKVEGMRQGAGGYVDIEFTVMIGSSQ